MLAAYMDKGGAGVAPPGVHEGVQTCSFVRASRGACNPKVAPCQFRPATNIGHADELRSPLVGALSLSAPEEINGMRRIRSPHVNRILGESTLSTMSLQSEMLLAPQ